MKLRPLLLLPLLGSTAMADTIRLRNGTELEGLVLREENDAYVVSVQVTRSIRDERRIPKREVLEIVAAREDKVAFEKLKSLLPTPDLLTTNDYVEYGNMLEAFMTEFSSSSHLKEVDQMLKALDAERKIVEAGGIKFEGKMIEGPERAARAYPLDARIAAAKVVERGDAGDLVGALRAWDDLEKDFSGSAAYRETTPYALRLMRTQLRSVNELLDTFDARVKSREDALLRIPENDRRRSQQAIVDESAAYAKRMAAEKEAGIKWPSLSAWDKEPLQATKSRLEQEIKKLGNFDASKNPDAEAAWDKAWETLSGTPEPAEVTAVISAARSARLPADYLAMLEKKAPAK